MTNLNLIFKEHEFEIMKKLKREKQVELDMDLSWTDIVRLGLDMDTRTNTDVIQ